MEYTLLDLITMLEDVVRKAAPMPFGKKSMVNVADIDEIATEMRLVLPREIQQAQNVVADKNRIISDAKKEAEEIIKKAEQQRERLIEENSILQEARKRALEIISKAQADSGMLRTTSYDTADKVLSKVEDCMAKNLNDLRIMRKAINNGSNTQPRPVPPPLPPENNQK